MNGKKASNYRHGGNVENKPEFNSWRAMRDRCNNPKNVHYSNYGGRGIKVCERWDKTTVGFINFMNDMGKKPDGRHTIDRINNNGNYEPDNCRWVNQKEQVRNSSTVKYYTINGKYDIITEHIKRSNVSTTLFYKRIKNGWSVEDAINISGEFTRLENILKRSHTFSEKRNSCMWCGIKVSKFRKKYCNANHYMLHRMNPGKTKFTY